MEIVETSVFTRRVQDLLDWDSYRLLQLELADRPERGRIIPGTGGIWKMRWEGSGSGKRGGTRVIYYWVREREIILLLLIYSKTDQEDLTPDQSKVLRRLVEEEFG
ncbi:MAG: type II toxin-antitoxin system RelE/ParE family toxin [Thioalkalivibrio sp.]|nr:type II toxin-antitoxin system RelE/ParE family toxin [Thioalkalivibrio sp.]